MIDTLKIGWKEYQVVVTKPDSTLHLDGHECFGTINYLDQVIYLRESNSDDQMMGTLIHEVLHGIGDMFSIEPLKKEKLTTKLATALYTVLKDNQLEIKRKEVNSDA